MSSSPYAPGGALPGDHLRQSLGPDQLARAQRPREAEQIVHGRVAATRRASLARHERRVRLPARPSVLGLPVVADHPAFRGPLLIEEGGGIHPGGPPYGLAQVILVALPGHLLDDGSEKDESAVAVLEACPGLEGQGLAGDELPVVRDLEVCRPVSAAGDGVQEVPRASRVRQEVTDGQLLRPRGKPVLTEVPGDRIVEAQPARVDELRTP